MAAARTAVDADLRRVAVPRRRFRFEPADRIVGILHARRIRRFRGERQVDGDDQHAAFGYRVIHRFFSLAVFCVPRAAVKIENGWKRSCPCRLIDAGHQLPSGFGTAILDFADFNAEFRSGIVGRRSRFDSGGNAEERHAPNKVPSS